MQDKIAVGMEIGMPLGPEVDAPTRAMAEYASNFAYGTLTQGQIDATKRHILDSIGCALGAMRGEPAEVARRTAPKVAEGGASVLGLPFLTTPEHATFANSVMVRYLDFNDAGIAGHASDAIPGILATAEVLGKSGRDVIAGTFVSYEVCHALYRNGGNLGALGKNGLDQPWVGPAVACGAGMVMGLTPQQFVYAIALGIVPIVPLRVARSGQMSHWKGCATAHGAMNAVFGVRLAKEGITAPSTPFSGPRGFRAVSGCKIDNLDNLGELLLGFSTIENMHFKVAPAHYRWSTYVEPFIELARQIDNVDDIESIELAMPEDHPTPPERWDPQTPETADHSMPFIIAATLADKAFSVDSYTLERVRDPALRPIMKKIRIWHDPELEKLLPKEHRHFSEWGSQINITLKDGRVLRKRTSYPKGTRHNPLSDDELVAKFHGLSDRTVSRDKADAIIDTVWRFDQLEDVRELTSLFRGL